MRTVRKLTEILRELELLTEQGRVTGFFNNVENADKLGGLVEDIRDAVMDYQVRIQHDAHFLVLDIRFRLFYNKIYTTKVASSL